MAYYDDQEELIADIQEAILDLDDDEFIQLYNDMHATAEYHIFPMDEFDNFFTENDYTPTELVDCLSSDFSTSDDYFTFDSDGTLVSFKYLSDTDVDFGIEEMAEEIAINGDDHNIDAIREIFER